MNNYLTLLTQRKYAPILAKMYIVTIFVSLPYVSISQELKPLIGYENSLRDFYKLKRHSQREEFKEFKAKPFWKYLPDIGLQFGLPSIQFRLSNYFQYKHDQHLQRIKLLSIDSKAQLEMNEKIQELRIDYQKLVIQQQRLSLAQAKLAKQMALFSIQYECCNRNECTPEECRLNDLRQFEASEAVRLLEMNYRVSLLELEKTAKYNLPTFDFVR